MKKKVIALIMIIPLIFLITIFSVGQVASILTEIPVSGIKITTQHTDGFINIDMAKYVNNPDSYYYMTAQVEPANANNTGYHFEVEPIDDETELASIDIDEDYHVHTCFDVNDESDKLETMNRLLKNLSEEFERRSKMVKYEEFTPNQWSSFLNSEINVKCATEEKAKEFLGILHSMGYTWVSGTLLTKYTHYSDDRTYTFNHGVQWNTTDYTKKPIFLYK